MELSCVLAIALGGCSLFVSTSGLEGGQGESGQDATAPLDAADAAEETITPTYVSCAAAHKALPAAVDGFFSIDSGDGGPPFQAYCDMTTDDGGWMLITPRMIADEPNVATTALHGVDDHGGLIVSEYPNSDACGGTDAGAHSRSAITFSAYPTWTQIRAHYTFDGKAGCWSIFGSASAGLEQNVIPFGPSVDIVYGEFKMGGILPDAGSVDAFNGATSHCDTANDNFWLQNVVSERTAVVAFRRSSAGSAGLATSVGCFDGPIVGTTATTHWSYTDIYVR